MKGALEMLTQILPSEARPRPATSHIANQPIVGIGSPAGDSGIAAAEASGDASAVRGLETAGLELTAWGRWLALAEALAEKSLIDDENAYSAFERGVYPETYVGALAEPCETCKIPGAPGHEPSRLCHYRPRIVNHCTCRACF